MVPIDKYKTKIRTILNKLVDRYEQLVYSDPTDPDSIAKRYRAAFMTLDLKPGLDILELGAGNGVFTVPLAIWDPKASIYALDIAEKMLLNLGMKLNNRFLNNVYLIHGDFDYLPFLPEKFDRIFYSYSIQDSPNPISTLLDATRVLKHGGKLVILGIGGGYEKIKDKTLDMVARASYPPHAHYYDIAEIESFLRQCELRDIKSSLVYMDSWFINGKKINVPLYTVSGNRD